MPTVFIRERARRDLIERFAYLAENADFAVSERFLRNAEASFNDLAINPKIGSLLTLRNPALVGVRKWPVKDFGTILIFYTPRQDGVSIVRVLHAAQDWWSLLDLSQ